MKCYTILLAAVAALALPQALAQDAPAATPAKYDTNAIGGDPNAAGRFAFHRPRTGARKLETQEETEQKYDTNAIGGDPNAAGRFAFHRPRTGARNLRDVERVAPRAPKLPVA